MSDEDIYDDDFHSDQGESPRSSPRGSPRNAGRRSQSPLMPIIEVPSEGSQSARSSEAPTARNQEYQSEDDSYEDDEEDEYSTPLASSRSASGRKRSKVRNGKHPAHVDMTPPDKLLKKAERKAKKYAQNKKTDEAMMELIRCTALARIVYGDGHWRLAHAYAKLAEGYCDLRGYFPQAQQHGEFARDIMVSRVQMTSSSTERPAILGCLINIYYVLGRALTANKKYNDASQCLNKAEKISRDRSKLHGVKDSEVDDWNIKISMAIARLNARQQKFALSVTYFEKALDVMERMHGPDSPELISVFQSLGRVEQSKGEHADHEKAIEHFLQAHSIASASYKDNSVEIADTAKALATAYSNVGDDTAETSAESYLNDALMIYQAVYGPNHEQTIEVQDDLARLMIRTDRQDEGLDMLKSTIEAKKEVYGDLSTEVADTWKLMGSTYLSKGDTEKALRALKKCHNVECAVHGSNSKKCKETQRTIDILMANPNLASKQKKSKMEELKERPRFNSTVSRSGSLGGYKPQTSY